MQKAKKVVKQQLKEVKRNKHLGLAIAKQIALKHDGTINIHSELSKGTEFVFRFQPIDEEEFV